MQSCLIFVKTSLLLNYIKCYNIKNLIQFTLFFYLEFGGHLYDPLFISNFKRNKLECIWSRKFYISHSNDVKSDKSPLFPQRFIQYRLFQSSYSVKQENSDTMMQTKFNSFLKNTKVNNLVISPRLWSWNKILSPLILETETSLFRIYISYL